MAIAAIPSKTAVKWIGLALVLLVVAGGNRRASPTRRGSSSIRSTAPCWRASRQLIMQAPVLRDIRVTFEVHPTMDRHFIYRILGGRIDGSALYTAVVNGDGSVRLE